MNKKLYLLILLLPLGINSLAQNMSSKVDIKWGNDIESSRKKTLSDLIAHDQSGFYALQKETKGLLVKSVDLSIDHYDNNANQTKSVDLSIDDGDKERSFENIIHLNGKLFLFTTAKDKKTKTNSLFVQTIDKTSLKPNRDIKKLIDVDYSNGKFLDYGDYSIHLSKDGSKVLVFYKLAFEKGSEKREFGFSVFDNAMNLIWSKIVTLPYKDELFDIERKKVDNEGNVYLLNTVYKEKRRKKRHGEPNYQYTILCLKAGNESFNEYPVELPGKFVTDMQFAVTNNQDFICTGFYSDKGTFSIKGCYYITIDGKSKEIKTQSYKEFSIDVLRENLTEKQQKKLDKKIEKGKQVELYEYDLNDVLIHDNGYATLVGEQYYIDIVTTTQTINNGTTTTTTTTTNYYYNYNDIIVVNIDPKGQIEWVSKIPKRQVTSNDHGFYSSYTMSYVNDKIYFIFNDNPKNLLEQTIATNKFGTFSAQKGSIAVLVEVDRDGNYKKEPLFKSADAEVMIRPKVCEMISGNELVLFGQRRKTERFAKLTFK